MEVSNKYVLTQYNILEKFEAGIILFGPEVKASKLKEVNFKGAYCSFANEQLNLKGFYIAPYKPAKREQSMYNPYRERKLLLHKKEIRYLNAKLKQKGITIIPLRLYSKKGILKLEVALAQGLKKYDKREKIKKRDLDREMRSVNY